MPCLARFKLPRRACRALDHRPRPSADDARCTAVPCGRVRSRSRYARPLRVAGTLCTRTRSAALGRPSRTHAAPHARHPPTLPLAAIPPGTSPRPGRRSAALAVRPHAYLIPVSAKRFGRRRRDTDSRPPLDMASTYLYETKLRGSWWACLDSIQTLTPVAAARAERRRSRDAPPAEPFFRVDFEVARHARA